MDMMFLFVDIVLDSHKIRIIGTARNGIINIWINQEKNIYSGYWGYENPKMNLKYLSL